MDYRILVLLICGALKGTSSAQTGSRTETPMLAGAFANAIGVTSHWERTSGSVYGNGGVLGHGDELEKMLIDLGVHHYRTKLVSDNPLFTQRILAIRSANHGTGPKGDFLVDIREKPETPEPTGPPKVGCSDVRPVGGGRKRALVQGDDAVSGIKDLYKYAELKLAGAVGFLEGPNEYDISHPSTDTKWETNLVGFSEKMVQLKSDYPGLRGVPLVAPAMGNVRHAQDDASPLNYKNSHLKFDYGSSHGYPRGKTPSNQLVLGLNTARTISGDLPIFQTETGYDNAVPGGSKQPGVTEDVAAVYGPRLVAEYLLTRSPEFYPGLQPGIELMNFYELADDNICPSDGETNFGLIRMTLKADGTTAVAPKPIYFALQHVIRLLESSGTKAEPLTYTIHAAEPGDSLHHMLLQKADGVYYLLLWHEARQATAAGPAIAGTAAIPGAQAVAEPKRQNVTVGVPSLHLKAVTAYLPTTNAGTTVRANESGSFEVPVASELVVVQLKPDGVLHY